MASYKELVAQREALDKQIEETRLAESKAAVAHRILDAVRPRLR